MKTKVFFGENLEKKLASILKACSADQIIFFYDSNLAKFAKKYSSIIKKPILIQIKAQESSKNLQHIFKIYQILLKKNISRSSVFVALGGGVLGDMVGFLAATYMRGVRLIEIPSTILSQVDSSIGGKNGVNLPMGKNAVGTIYQPQAVLIDYSFLKTLPDRELVSGFGEILKYSLLNSKIIFPKLSGRNLKRNDLLKTIKKLTPSCVSYKLKLVQKDESDEKGIRQALNLGHTFAHVLESITRYKKFRHGEAVIYGLKFCMIVSYLKNIISFEDFREFMNLANKLPVPRLPQPLSIEKCYRLALKDKKSTHGIVKMVLVAGKGKVLVNQVVDKKTFSEAVQILKEMSL